MNLSVEGNNQLQLLKPAAPLQRPRIGLVLGSGGVRSAAAIGVTEVLEEAGLAPDLVVGCSSGALFGALVASRTPAVQAMEKAVALWSQDLTRRHRWTSYLQLMFPRLAGFSPDFSLRRSDAIRERVSQAFGDTMLESLPIPMRVVATSADTGRQAVLQHGPLTDALCASMALPFIFPPVVVRGRRLVDGVICDPLPVSAAYDAHVIVALGFEGRLPSNVDRPSKLIGQVSTSLINNLMSARVELARAQGKLVLPLELEMTGHVGLWDTRALPSMRDAGRAAMTQALPRLRGLLAQAGT